MLDDIPEGSPSRSTMDRRRLLITAGGAAAAAGLPGHSLAQGKYAGQNVVFARSAYETGMAAACTIASAARSVQK